MLNFLGNDLNIRDMDSSKTSKKMKSDVCHCLVNGLFQKADAPTVHVSGEEITSQVEDACK